MSSPQYQSVNTAVSFDEEKAKETAKQLYEGKYKKAEMAIFMANT